MDAETMVRRTAMIDGRAHELAQDQDVASLKASIEAAVRDGGRFVELLVVGNRSVSVLVTGRSQAVLTEETVQFDPRDDGNVDVPFGGLFDL